MLKQTLKKVISIFQWLLTIVLVSVVLLLIFTALDPVKSFRVLRVMSGSMEPAIHVGSVVFVQKVNPETLRKGDVITFASADDPTISITHRLAEIENSGGNTVFKTKGDANSIEDSTEISSSQIKGKVLFSLPFLGYLSVWIKQPLGFGLLVILPAILIIISEIFSIKKSIEKEVEKKYEESEKQRQSKSAGTLIMLCLLGIGFLQIKSTNAYLSDTAVITGTTFSAGYWEAKNGDVVINEVMWMGTNTSGGDDEWVELRNTTSSQIDLAGWKINLGPSGKDIILSGIIPSGGFFLITERPTDDSAISNGVISNQVYPTMTLPDSGRRLVLRESSGTIIDQTPTGPWPAGDHHGEIRRSMERNGTPGDGALIDSWHTCTDEQCNDTTYWDIEGNNYGTPGYPNLSDGDTTDISLNFYLNPDGHSVSFEISGPGLSYFDTAEYQITYDSEQAKQGIIGTKTIGGVNNIEENNLILGSCSSGEKCVYNTGIKSVNLKVSLHKTAEDKTSDKILEQGISM